VTRIDPKRWYTTREASDLLDRAVTADTIKRYCKAGYYKELRITAQQRGPLQQWHILGASVEDIRRLWLGG
jgi:hypothetical protein